MSETDKMFEELGFEIDMDCLGIIRYARHNEDEDYYIKFYLNDKEFDCNMVIDNQIYPLAINMRLLQAIYTKMKELGC